MKQEIFEELCKIIQDLCLDIVIPKENNIGFELKIMLKFGEKEWRKYLNMNI